RRPAPRPGSAVGKIRERLVETLALAVGAVEGGHVLVDRGRGVLALDALGAAVVVLGVVLERAHLVVLLAVGGAIVVVGLVLEIGQLTSAILGGRRAGRVVVVARVVLDQVLVGGAVVTEHPVVVAVLLVVEAAEVVVEVTALGAGRLIVVAGVALVVEVD